MTIRREFRIDLTEKEIKESFWELAEREVYWAIYVHSDGADNDILERESDAVMQRIKRRVSMVFREEQEAAIEIVKNEMRSTESVAE